MSYGSVFLFFFPNGNIFDSITSGNLSRERECAAGTLAFFLPLQGEISGKEKKKTIIFWTQIAGKYR